MRRGPIFDNDDDVPAGQRDTVVGRPSYEEAQQKHKEELKSKR